MSLEVVKHTNVDPADYIKMAVMVEEVAALMLASAKRTAPPGAVVEATALATLVEGAGRAAPFHDLSDDNFAQAVGMGMGSAMMKRGGEVLDLGAAIQAFVRGFSYSINALATMAPGPPETAQ